MVRKGKTRPVLIAAVLVLLLAMMPVLAAATPLVTTDLHLHKVSPKNVGQRFLIRGNLSSASYNPVLQIGSALFLDGKTVEIYRKVGSTGTWSILNSQSTGPLGGYRLPMQEFTTGKYHYMAVYWGDSGIPGSYEKITVTIE